MAQFGRPTNDHTNIGPFVNEVGSSTNLYLSIDEVAAADGDYVESPSNPTGTERYSSLLSAVIDPRSSTGHIVRYRYAKSASAGRTIDVTMALVEDQGGTDVVIASWTHTNVSNVAATVAQTLSGAQADAILDYSKLRIRFDPVSSGGGQGRASRLYWAEMETPDPPPAQNFTRTATDTIAIGADSVLRIMGQSRTATDTTAVTDSPTRLLAASRTATDTTSVTDSPVPTAAGRVRVYDVEFEVPGMLGGAGDAFTLTATDTVATSDAVAHAQVAVRTATDTVATSEAVASLVVALRTADDTTSVGESLATLKNVTRFAEDTTSTTDAIDRVSGIARSATDSAPIGADEVGSNGSIYERLLDDATVASESVERIVATARDATDTTSVTDTLDRQGAFARTTSDVTAVTDVINQGLTRRADDTVVTTDSVSRSGTFERAADDAVTTTDSIASNGVYVRTATDSTSVTDAAATSSVLTRTADDTTSVTDAADATHRGPDQVVEPDADVGGDWVREDANPATPFFPALGDASDATYIRSPDPTAAPSNFAEVGLADAADPTTSTGHRVVYRIRTQGTAGVVVELRQGTTVIASWAHGSVPSATEFERTLTASEADAITDYTDLRIRARAV